MSLIRTRTESFARWADTTVLGGIYERVLELEFVDRSIALAAKTFVAFFPYLLVVSSVLPPDLRESVTANLVDRFGLSGIGEDILRGAFANPEQIRAATGWLGFLLLLFFAVSFTTALQRTYLRAWRRPAARGLRQRSRGLIWLAGTSALIIINGLTSQLFTGTPGDVARSVITVFTVVGVWWWTPRIMLRGEIRWRAVFPGALITGLGSIAYVLVSPIWMPRTMLTNQEQFGFFGVTLTLVTWFVGLSFLIVISACIGPVLAESDTAVGRWVRAGGILEEGAPQALPAPRARVRLVDAFGRPEAHESR